MFVGNTRSLPQRGASERSFTLEALALIENVSLGLKSPPWTNISKIKK
jgi:hypothetical protein